MDIHANSTIEVCSLDYKNELFGRACFSVSNNDLTGQAQKLEVISNGSSRAAKLFVGHLVEVHLCIELDPNALTVGEIGAVLPDYRNQANTNLLYLINAETNLSLKPSPAYTKHYVI